MDLNLKSLFKFTKEALSELYELNEAGFLAYYIFEEAFGFHKRDILLDPEKPLSLSVFQRIETIIGRIKENEPLQYIFGSAHFYGRRFWVDNSVLIPRPETEELVQLILDDYKNSKFVKALDVCTGSGCIPITLKAELGPADIHGLDISDPALAIARKNMETLKFPVSFFKCDILREDIAMKDLDFVVSNPPYVLESEKVNMKKNVLDFEPELALFVKDGSPLIFYENIALKSREALKKGGKLYFEINEKLAGETVHLLELLGYKAMTVFKDMQGKDRIIRAEKPT